MLSGKENVPLRHPALDYLYIIYGIRHAGLKVAVATIAGEVVVAPFGG